MLDLFSNDRRREAIKPGAVLLSGYALDYEKELFTALTDVTTQAPFRIMTTPGGYAMSVSMTSCGVYGWVTDRTGYRYIDHDPVSGLPWPRMPAIFLEVAMKAAAAAGFSDFAPDSCLINRYEPKAKLSLHQDKDEKNLNAPVVSVSLGLSATFLFGGNERKDPLKRLILRHGDVIVWGGPARLAYHGILPIKADEDSILGNIRLNLTFRKSH